MKNLLWKSDLENGVYKNPIIFADYSDPDVIRVGDTYYMTASSFNYIPGLPILISKDLVNWELVNYALKRIPYPEYDVPQHAKGVWAPAIRFHEGAFYIYYGMPDEGIFMVKTKNPREDWDEPVCVLAGKGLIDSCPFWDDDGRAYIVHGYANSRIGFKSHLGIFEMNAEGTKAISEDHILYCGLETQPTIEGPKVYKFDGKYYILAPAGGVTKGWQTALRADSIKGPFEEMVICRQGNTEINGPHQGALIDTPNGDWWFIHFQDRGLYGRICHLQPVTWKDGWPVVGINADGYCGEPVMEYSKPIVEHGKPTIEYARSAVESCRQAKLSYLEASDDFSSEKLSLCWQFLGNVGNDAYRLIPKKGILRLKALSGDTIWNSSNVITQKIVTPFFDCSVKIDFSELSDGQRAGIVMMGGEYAYLAVRNVAGTYMLVYGLSTAKPVYPETGYAPAWLVPYKAETEITIAELDGCRQMILGLSLNQDGFAMAYAIDDDKADSGDDKLLVNSSDCSAGYEYLTEVSESRDFMPSDHTWVGSKIGLFGNAEYSDFKVSAR